MNQFNYKTKATTFRSLIHFDLFCMWCEIRVRLHSCACGYLVVSASFVEKTVLSPLNGLGIPVES